MFLCCEVLTTGDFKEVDFLGLFLDGYEFLALICNKRERDISFNTQSYFFFWETPLLPPKQESKLQEPSCEYKAI